MNLYKIYHKPTWDVNKIEITGYDKLEEGNNFTQILDSLGYYQRVILVTGGERMIYHQHTYLIIDLDMEFLNIGEKYLKNVVLQYIRNDKILRIESI
jgi:uncharacterized protein (UPF0248 family)